MKNTLKTTSEVKAVVDAYIDYYEQWNRRIPADYCLGVIVTDEQIHWKIRFEWIYQEVIKGSEPNQSVSHKQTTNSFIWLKGECYINLMTDIDRMLDMVLADEIEIIKEK